MCLAKKAKKIIADLEEIGRLLIHHEIQALQSKIKIKEKKNLKCNYQYMKL